MFKFMDSELQESVTKVCESLRMYHVACEAINEFGKGAYAQWKLEEVNRIDKEIINEGVIPKLEKCVKNEILIGAHHNFKYRHFNTKVIYYIGGVPFCAYSAVTDEVAVLLQLVRSESYLVGNKLPEYIVDEAVVILSDFVNLSIKQFAQKYCKIKSQAKIRPGVERLLTEMQKRMVVCPLSDNLCLNAGGEFSNQEKTLVGTIRNSDEFLLDVIQYVGHNEEYNVTYDGGVYTINDIYVLDNVSIDIFFYRDDYKLIAKGMEVHLNCNNGNANLSVESLIDEVIGEDFGLSYEGKLELEDWFSENTDVQPEVRTISNPIKERNEHLKMFKRNFMEDYYKKAEEEEEDFDEDEVMEPPCPDFYQEF